MSFMSGYNNSKTKNTELEHACGFRNSSLFCVVLFCFTFFGFCLISGQNKVVLEAPHFGTDSQISSTIVLKVIYSLDLFFFQSFYPKHPFLNLII